MISGSAIEFYYRRQKADIMNCRWINSTAGKKKKIAFFCFFFAVNGPVKKVYRNCFLLPNISPSKSD